MQPADDMLWFCFGHRSRKAARAVTRAFNQRLKPFGLNISQYVLLGVIARGEHRSIAAMAEEVGVEPSALVRNLRLLEARGLVAGEGGRGRGGRQLAVTPQGADLIEQTIPAWRRAQADLAARLDGDPDETRQALVRLEHAALALERAER
ncbi:MULTISPECIES: MarR family winged helix-turn-helix transcriptional regulator [unclassified Phenylobacterium]|uniref:MarR family winged helix-turn-helix transcriptional regulator n=1 Tax=unclassified Phenylobacterium TaxID=2640670 RepID=UPI0022653469|nr:MULTISPECIES: MarR family winged helix-turn-helix transcriptional regulator [unclassified Phenylobacterium]MCX7586192.1 MarR family winged helix-turn-helix transcriptional regulator [Phenylobacterium sp. 58.2.17]WGU39745.1 MarR family winged helix-turn-helix transcriptional regulator [Phenylobacterium sp. NIBR 498073]